MEYERRLHCDETYPDMLRMVVLLRGFCDSFRNRFRRRVRSSRDIILRNLSYHIQECVVISGIQFEIARASGAASFRSTTRCTRERLPPQALYHLFRKAFSPVFGTFALSVGEGIDAAEIHHGQESKVFVSTLSGQMTRRMRFADVSPSRDYR